MSQRGYTLFELLVVIAICAVTASFAITSAQAFFKREEARRVIDNLRILIQTGKTHALTHRRHLTICGSLDGKNCHPDWNSGLLLLEDANNNGVQDGSDQVLQYIALNIAPSTLSWSGFGGPRLSIENTGITFAGNGAFTYCRQDQDLLYRRQLIINRGGRVRLSKDSNHDGIHEDNSGNPVRCR